MFELAQFLESTEFSAWLRWAGIAWLIYILFLSIWIILQKHSPVSTLGWIFTLAFMPYAGFIIYHFLGPQKLKRQQFRRLLSKTALREHSDYLHVQNRMLSHKRHSMELAQLSNMIRNATDFPLSTAHEMRLLVDGQQTFNAIVQAIKDAHHHVHLEYYIFEPDEIGFLIRNLLIEKLKQGVKVKLLVDGIGSPRLNDLFLDPFLEAGGEFAVFHRPGMLHVIKPLLNLRNHRKIIVCDGLIGFSGGLNITADEDERIREHAYHDTHVVMTGNVVHWLQMVFMEDWIYASGSSNMPSTLEYYPIQMTGSYPVQVVPSGPDNDWEIIHRLYLTMIQNAKRSIFLTTPYFVPTEPALYALTSAALRGIDVRILVPHKSDSRIVTAAARSYFDELIAAGVRIWEYQGRMLHSKTIVIDQQYSMIGTANFDIRSFRLNFEVGLMAYGNKLATTLATQFEKDLQQSTEVLANRTVSWLEKLFEASCRLLSPLL